MTRRGWVVGMMAVALMGAAMAEPADTASLTFNDPSKPKVLKVNVTMGSVTVRGGGTGNTVMVSSTEGIEKLTGRPPKEAEGMKRVKLAGGTDYKFEVKDNVAEISSGWGAGDLTITVPTDTNLNLRTSQGEIRVENIGGEIDANASMGEVKISGATNAVVAHSSMGKVVVVWNTLPNKPVSIASMMGDVDVTLPADTKATLLIREGMHTDVFSDFDIKAEGTVDASEKTKNGVRKRQLSRGTINGGGPEIQLITSMGNVMIRRKK